jgi:hypothetical protein
MYTLHCTQKLLARIKEPTTAAVPTATTALGNWYATALLWKPQVALFVNESSRLPLFMPLAPAKTLAARFPLHLEALLIAHGAPAGFAAHEVAAMTEVTVAKTASRSIVGTMNDFTWLAGSAEGTTDLDELRYLSKRLANRPIGPMGHKYPIDVLDEVVERWKACNDTE